MRQEKTLNYINHESRGIEVEQSPKQDICPKVGPLERLYLSHNTHHIHQRHSRQRNQYHTANSVAYSFPADGYFLSYQMHKSGDSEAADD